MRLCRGRSGGIVYISGDTGYGKHFEQIAGRFRPPRLAVLPIRSSRPRWLMSRIHLPAEKAVQAHRLLGAGTTLAVHFGTFALADDGEQEPIQRLRAALAEAKISENRFWILGFGESRFVP